MQVITVIYARNVQLKMNVAGIIFLQTSCFQKNETKAIEFFHLSSFE